MKIENVENGSLPNFGKKIFLKDVFSIIICNVVTN